MDTSPADEAFGRWRAAMLDSLAGTASPDSSNPAVYTDAGRVIFPALML